MRATCPSCEAVYEIPDRLAGTGRRLRCAKCGHEWPLQPAAGDAVPSDGAPSAASAPPAPLAPPPALTPGPPSAGAYGSALRPPLMEAEAPPPQARPMLRRAPQVIDPPLPAVDDAAGFRHRGGLALRLAWIASVLAVLLALGAMWTFRYEIADAWPPASRLTGSPVGGG